MVNIYLLSSVSHSDVAQVGGKGASLGEMIQLGERYNINVPPGFVVSIDAYSKFLQYNNVIIDDKSSDSIKDAI